MSQDTGTMLRALLVTCVFLTGNALQNLSVGKSANQTDTAFNGPPDLSVDGNINTKHYYGSCSHTDSTTNAWWEVDLGNIYRIHHVRVFGRQDCCTQRLREVQLFIGVDRSLDGPDGYALRGFYAETLPVPYTFQLTSPVVGRWVRITRLSTVKEHLALCEVEVMGEEISEAKFVLGEGKIGTGNILQTSQARTKTECCIQCKMVDKCSAVNYSSITKVCEKLESVSTKENFSDDSSFYRLS